jgi:hypothetical protein
MLFFVETRIFFCLHTHSQATHETVLERYYCTAIRVPGMHHTRHKKESLSNLELQLLFTSLGLNHFLLILLEIIMEAILSILPQT